MLLGPLIFKWFNIDSLLGKGISLGSGSHVIGTSKAIEYGELTASMSSVSMTLSAVIGSILAPIFVWLMLVTKKEAKAMEIHPWALYF